MNLFLRWEGGISSIDHPLREVRSERLSAVSAKTNSLVPIVLYLEGRRQLSLDSLIENVSLDTPPQWTPFCRQIQNYGSFLCFAGGGAAYPS
jgi:hypothetical protein